MFATITTASPGHPGIRAVIVILHAHARTIATLT
jgi:hypothetical protein